MNRYHLACTAAAVCLGFSSVAFSQMSEGGAPKSGSAATARTADCSGLTGAALDTCVKQNTERKGTPGTAASERSGTNAPVGGTSESSATGKAKGGSSY